MIYLIGVLATIGFGFLSAGLWMIFSPSYNTTEDYIALLPTAFGIVVLALTGVIWIGWEFWRWFH